MASVKTRTSRRTFTTARVPTGVAITPSTVKPTWGTGLTITGTVSGSGTTAVAAFLAGRSDRAVEVQLPGGKLQLEYLESGHVLMTGPAKTTFTATIDIPSFG